jgi:retron-type reverse transcriptase
VARFFFRLEPELVRLQEELTSMTYRPGPYRTFTIYEGKARQISAAPFRDRVVHHALTGILEPIFERSFIHDSYACRKGKGTHAAVDRCQQLARRHAYVLKADVRRFFPSIDHVILKNQIARRIKDPRVLWLVNTIVDHSNPQLPAIMWFPGDDLFTPIERRRGLPLGNQTSQFFANVYLDALDHFVTDRLRFSYVRYVDAFTRCALKSAGSSSNFGCAFTKRRASSLRPATASAFSATACSRPTDCSPNKMCAGFGAGCAGCNDPLPPGISRYGPSVRES